MAFPSHQDWRAWLEEHHAESAGVWLQIPHKGTGTPGLTYSDALDAALCFGWIDGQKAKADLDGHWLQRFTPRKPRSRWSRINRDRATRLLDEGLMRPAGLREIERAKADGRWDAAYEGQRAATVPDDLRAALAANTAAQAEFDVLDSANRYAILYRIAEAKRPETRARRIAKYVAMLAEGGRIHS
jgi:uncharacterized protein YdeI (YjbR/CyaY-like superfamily)